MNVTFGDFKSELRRLIDDTGELKSDALLADSLKGALVAVLPWHSKESTQLLTSGSGGETYQFALPSDFYDVDGVHDTESSKFLRRATMMPYQYAGENLDQFTYDIYPHGYIRFWPDPETGDTFTLYYRAYWSVPTTDLSLLDPPLHLKQALLYYAAARAVMPEAESSAELRQYNTKIDSGTPAHNPVGDRVFFFMRLFELEVKRQLSQPRGTQT